MRAGATKPDISRTEAVRATVLAAKNLSYSTGPSGVALAKLFEIWGIAEEIQPRIVQAPPGVPVGRLVARGEVELGFQQLSELIHLEGITLLGPLPAEIQITTTFSAAISLASAHRAYASALLVKSGIGTEAQKSLFRKLGALTGSPGAGTPAWLMSHPSTEDRIRAIEAREARWVQT